MEAFFVIGSLGFYLSIAFVFFGIMALVEYSHEIIAAIVVVAELWILSKYAEVDIFGFVHRNPVVILGFVAGYFAIGAAWSVFKWYFFLKAGRREYNRLKSIVMMESKNVAGWTDHDISAETERRFNRTCYYEIRPNVTGHKGEIMRWIAYWPTSFVWTMIRGAVRRFTHIVSDIFYSMEEMLQKMSDNMWKDVNKDSR